MKEYIQSIDNRLSKIESTVLEINAEVRGLKVRVYGISAAISLTLAGLVSWLLGS